MILQMQHPTWFLVLAIAAPILVTQGHMDT
jgi:hypothetical protein